MGEGQWVNEPVGLGHRLLCTTPESLSEKQPVTDERGECWLVWDGRLDNREEMIASLKAEARFPGGETDPELVLGAYCQWGAELPHADYRGVCVCPLGWADTQPPVYQESDWGQAVLLSLGRRLIARWLGGKGPVCRSYHRQAGQRVDDR